MRNLILNVHNKRSALGIEYMYDYVGCALMYGTLACGSTCLAASRDFWHGFYWSYTER